jgi:hypothetical protein
LGPIDAFWHLLNFFGPALGLGLITPLFAKLLWRRDLKSVAWVRLAVWTSLACAAVAVAGLVVFGHDGKMATYAAMVGVSALTLWWLGWGARSR